MSSYTKSEEKPSDGPIKKRETKGQNWSHILHEEAYLTNTFRLFFTSSCKTRSAYIF